MPKYILILKLTLVCMLCCCVSFAYAQQEWEVHGLKIGTSPTKVESILKSESTEKATFDVFTGKNEIPLGFQFVDYVEGHRDMIRGCYTPSKEQGELSAVLREISYSGHLKPFMDELVASLEEKYGKPIVKDYSDRFILFWEKGMPEDLKEAIFTAGEDAFLYFYRLIDNMETEDGYCKEPPDANLAGSVFGVEIYEDLFIEGMVGEVNYLLIDNGKIVDSVSMYSCD